MLVFCERVYNDVLMNLTEDFCSPRLWAKLGTARDYLVQVTIQQLNKITSLTLSIDSSFDGVNWTEIFTDTSPAIATGTKTVYFKSVQVQVARGPLARVRLRLGSTATNARVTVDIAGRANDHVIQQTALAVRSRLPFAEIFGTRHAALSVLKKRLALSSSFLPPPKISTPSLMPERAACNDGCGCAPSCGDGKEKRGRTKHKAIAEPLLDRFGIAQAGAGVKRKTVRRRR